MAKKTSLHFFVIYFGDLYSDIFSVVLFSNNVQTQNGVLIRPRVKNSNPMVIKPGICTFGSVGRCQVLLENWNQHLHEAEGSMKWPEISW